MHPIARSWFQIPLLLSASVIGWSQSIQLAGLQVAGGEAGDLLGDSVAVSGDLALVGAPGADHLFYDAGSAYVFERDATGAWTLVAELVASSTMEDAYFGSAVALDGDTALVGAYGEDSAGMNSGAAYVFERDAGGPNVWGQVARFVGLTKHDEFGGAVAVRGQVAMIGAINEHNFDIPEAGAVHVIERSQATGTWRRVRRIRASGAGRHDHFGDCISLVSDVAIVGAPDRDQGPLLDAGGAYVFAAEGPGGSWTEVAALVSPDPQLSGHFGRTVAICGELAIVGAPSQSAQGITGAGSVYVYEALGGDWHLTDTWNASNAASADGFGSSLALAPDRALVGAFTDDPLVGKDLGSVYRFERFQGGPWVELEQLGAQSPQAFEYFGSGLSLQDDLALIGAFGHDDGYAIGNVESLAFDPVGDTLYGSDTYSLFTVDRATGAGKPVGSFGGTVAGLAFAADTNTLYGSDLVNDQLVRVDPSTGTQQPIGPLGFDEVQGMTYDPVSATLYGADLTTDQLLEIDVHTGAASPVGPLGFTRVYCLAFDPNSGVMYACDAATDLLLVVEPTTGAGSAVGPLVFKDVRGLAMDSLAGVLYGANRLNGLFLEIDARTAACTLIGPFYTLVSNIGAACVYGIY